MGTVLVEVRDEPKGTLGKGTLGSARRVCGVHRAALCLRGDTTLARRVGVHGTLLRLRPCDRTLAGPQRPRTPGGADILPDTEGATTLGQGVCGRGAAAVRCLADRDALGRRDVRVVGGARLATAVGSLGTRALVLRHVL